VSRSGTVVALFFEIGTELSRFYGATGTLYAQRLSEKKRYHRTTAWGGLLPLLHSDSLVEDTHNIFQALQHHHTTVAILDKQQTV
jgi:hypothetical protein